MAIFKRSYLFQTIISGIHSLYSFRECILECHLQNFGKTSSRMWVPARFWTCKSNNHGQKRPGNLYQKRCLGTGKNMATDDTPKLWFRKRCLFQLILILICLFLGICLEFRWGTSCKLYIQGMFVLHKGRFFQHWIRSYFAELKQLLIKPCKSILLHPNYCARKI